LGSEFSRGVDGSKTVKQSVKGRLNKTAKRLHGISDSSQFVTNMISEGYKLPFTEYPTPCFMKNNRSALKHPDFVAEAITELLSSNCIVEHDSPLPSNGSERQEAPISN